MEANLKFIKTRVKNLSSDANMHLLARLYNQSEKRMRDQEIMLVKYFDETSNHIYYDDNFSSCVYEFGINIVSVTCVFPK